MIDVDLGASVKLAEIDTELIRKERLRRRWTVLGLSNRSGVSRYTIFRIEKRYVKDVGKYSVTGVYVETLLKLAAVFGKELADLLLEDSRP